MASDLPSSKSWSLQGDVMLSCSDGVPLSDRGFRYGQHLFETVAARGGHYLFASEHCERLAKAAQRFNFPFSKIDFFQNSTADANDSVAPVLASSSTSLYTAGLRVGAPCPSSPAASFERSLFSKKTEEALSAFLKTTPPGDGMLRIMLTAGDGAPASPVVAPRLFAFWEETAFPCQQELKQGIALVSLDQPIGTACWGEKTGNYWEHLRALEVARAAGAAEGLVFDAAGHVISAAMANLIVWFADGSVVTPSQARGSRDGVVLAWVREQNPNMIERAMTRSDLSQTVAMALTNSRLGVMPVATLDEITLSHSSLALALADDYLTFHAFQEPSC